MNCRFRWNNKPENNQKDDVNKRSRGRWNKHNRFRITRLYNKNKLNVSLIHFLQTEMYCKLPLKVFGPNFLIFVCES